MAKLSGAARWARAVWLWAPPVVEMALIFNVSAMPTPPALPGGLSDRAGHLMAYALLGALLLRALASGTWRGVTATTTMWAATLATLYGVSDELHQAFVPSRHAELGDLVVDAVGAWAAALAGWAWSIIVATRAGRARAG
jgi:VanZ family protein